MDETIQSHNQKPAAVWSSGGGAYDAINAEIAFVGRSFADANGLVGQLHVHGIGIGLGYVPPEFSQANTPLAIEIRGKPAPAIVVPKPIYRRQKPG